MIKKQIIAPTLLIATILIGGITSCTSSNSPNTSPEDNTATNGSETKTTTTNNNKENTGERSQKREAVRKQIEAVLTPQQVKELSAKLQQGEKMRKALSSLNLSADQKTKIQEIMKTAYPHHEKQSQENSQ
jgi:Spy/CpxP family protein refolding chaperone